MISNRLFLLMIISLNLLFVFLLIHKQNKIIHVQYELQQLEKIKQDLLEQKKYLMVSIQKGQQLSDVQTFATNSLQMQSLNLKDAGQIPKN